MQKYVIIHWQWVEHHNQQSQNSNQTWYNKSVHADRLVNETKTETVKIRGQSIWLKQHIDNLLEELILSALPYLFLNRLAKSFDFPREDLENWNK